MDQHSFRRNDDSEEVVRKRIETYKNETFPLMTIIRTHGMLQVIDGYQPEEELANYNY